MVFENHMFPSTLADTFKTSVFGTVFYFNVNGMKMFHFFLASLGKHFFEGSNLEFGSVSCPRGKNSLKNVHYGEQEFTVGSILP